MGECDVHEAMAEPHVGVTHLNAGSTRTAQKLKRRLVKV